jgi:hypothetical protein
VVLIPGGEAHAIEDAVAKAHETEPFTSRRHCDQWERSLRAPPSRAGVKVSKHAPARTLRRTITQALEDPRLIEGAQTVASALARSDSAVETANRLERLASHAAVDPRLPTRLP